MQTKRAAADQISSLKSMMTLERVKLEKKVHHIRDHYERERVLMAKQVVEAHEFVLYLAKKCDNN